MEMTSEKLSSTPEMFERERFFLETRSPRELAAAVKLGISISELKNIHLTEELNSVLYDLKHSSGIHDNEWTKKNDEDRLKKITAELAEAKKLDPNIEVNIEQFNKAINATKKTDIDKLVTNKIGIPTEQFVATKMELTDKEKRAFQIENEISLSQLKKLGQPEKKYIKNLLLELKRLKIEIGPSYEIKLKEYEEIYSKTRYDALLRYFSY